MTLKIGSLCTGYGGLDLAVDAWYGAHTVWTSDIDPGASKIIAHRYPGAPNLGDLTCIDWATVPRCDPVGATVQRVAAAGSGEESPAHAESKGRTRPEGIPRRPDPALSRTQDWGIYRPAIRRWEHVTGRIAPRPVEQTRRGAWRLSPWFDEWLMGLPEGWICDTPGLSWNEALAAAGNGVVWQQAYEALRRLAW